MNAALLAGTAGAGAFGTAFTAAKAMASKFGGTNQAASAKTQSILDQSINKLSQITKSNTQTSKEFADAANAFTAAQNDKAMEFSAKEAAKNRDWQKMMSDTAHQREIKDLQAAGLNPVLSAMGGNGAAVGSGATAQSSSGSGQKGEVDTSLSHGMVSLLGSMLSSQTQLAQTAMSARSNEAIAEKNNSMQHLIAELTGQYSLARQQMAGEYGLKQTGISAAASRYMAELSSAASRYGSDQALAASKYATDVGSSDKTEGRKTDLWKTILTNPQAAAGAVLGELFGADGLMDSFVDRAAGVPKEGVKFSGRGNGFTSGRRKGGGFGGKR